MFMEVASPPNWREACHGKGSNERVHLADLPGCKGTARAEGSAEEPGRPDEVGEPVSPNRDRECITCFLALLGVGGVHSSEEAGNDRGAKGPC